MEYEYFEIEVTAEEGDTIGKHIVIYESKEY